MFPRRSPFIEEKWKAFLNRSDHWINIFVDERFAEQYESEEKVADIISIFGILGIFIATLGLFGAGFVYGTASNKRNWYPKSTWRVDKFGLESELLSDFGVLVLISNVIAWPVAYYVMSEIWLPRISLSDQSDARNDLSHSGYAFDHHYYTERSVIRLSRPQKRIR